MPQPLVVPADLARSEAFYHSLFDLSPDGVIVADIKGTIVQANPRAAEILQFDSPQELIGSNVIELYVHPEGRTDLLTQISQNPRLEGWRGEFRTRREKTIVTTSSSRLIDYEGQPCLLSVFRDDTERPACNKRCKTLPTQPATISKPPCGPSKAMRAGFWRTMAMCSTALAVNLCAEKLITMPCT